MRLFKTRKKKNSTTESLTNLLPIEQIQPTVSNNANNQKADQQVYELLPTAWIKKQAPSTCVLPNNNSNQETLLVEEKDLKVTREVIIPRVNSVGDQLNIRASLLPPPASLPANSELNQKKPSSSTPQLNSNN